MNRIIRNNQLDTSKGYKTVSILMIVTHTIPLS